MTESTPSTGVSNERLQSIVARIETQEEEKSEIMATIKDIYSEAKGEGFDVKVLRAIVRRRKMDREERKELDELTELYEATLGMV